MPPTPNADNLLLGAGQCFIAPFDADGLARRWRHLGNCEALESTTTDDPLIKKSSMTANRPIYKRINRGREVVLRVVGDEFSPENVALVTMGDLAYTTQAATPVADQVLVTDVDTIGTGALGEVLGNSYYHVGALNIGTVSMDLGATPLVDGTDFMVHSASMGVVKILDTSVVAVTAGDDLTVSFTPVAITGQDAAIVHGGTLANQEFAFMYIADNSAGPNGILRAWNVAASPDGALGFISEEFATFALNLTVQDDSAGNHGGSATDPLYHIQYLPPAA